MRIEEKLLTYLFLLKIGFRLATQYNNYLDKVFLDHPDNELLVELQWYSSDYSKSMEILYTYCGENISFVRLGALLIEKLRAAYERNSNRDIPIFEAADYKTWRLTQETSQAQESVNYMRCADTQLFLSEIEPKKNSFGYISADNDFTIKGAILEKGEECRTRLNGVFSAIKNAQLNYNWLITDLECCPSIQSVKDELFQKEKYAWLSGEELTALIAIEDFQWIWAVLSGFDKHIPLQKVLEYDLPYADCNRGIWENPVSIQHPLADVEIVAWDGSATLIISKNKAIVDNFKKEISFSKDLYE
jgi:hypothetical protein